MQELDRNEIERARGYARLLRRGINRLKALSSAVLEPYGITEPQYLALLWIGSHEGLIQGDLVAELDSDPNTISAILRKLDAKGLIRRKPHPADRRAVRLAASAKGKKLVSVIRPQMDRITGLLPASIPAGHEAAVAEWLERLAQIRELP